MKAANVVHPGYRAFLSENLSKLGLEQHTWTKKLIGEEKIYREVQKMLDRSAKMFSNALKWQPNPEK